MSHLTWSYSAIHAAIREVGRDREVEPYVVRVLLAIHDRGGEAVSDQLEADLGEDGSAIRRALLRCYALDLANGVARLDGGPRRRGVRSRVTLTPSGADIAHSVVRQFGETSK